MRMMAMFTMLLLLFASTGCSIQHDRHDLARAQLRQIGAKLKTFHHDVGQLPGNLQQLLSSHGLDGWLGPYAAEGHLIDPWGRRFFYRSSRDGSSFYLFTLGQDGRVGGIGANADVEVFEQLSNSDD